jgi:Uri superfamily endonuclease
VLFPNCRTEWETNEPAKDEKEVNPLQGIYVLVIRLSKDITVNVGALGQTAFEKGWYAYVGSAQNSLEQRVKRHLRNEKRSFWHIDYLIGSDNAKIIKVLYKEGGKKEECRIAGEISERGKAISGFGCSDCRCRSHLFRVGDFCFLLENMKEFRIGTTRKTKSRKS